MSDFPLRVFGLGVWGYVAKERVFGFGILGEGVSKNEPRKKMYFFSALTKFSNSEFRAFIIIVSAASQSIISSEFLRC